MKPRLLLVSGWAHPAESMDPLAALLADLFKTTTVAAPDFHPDKPRGGPIHLLGWSLGGMLAMQAALHQPAAVTRLYLVNTTARFTASTDWLHGLPRREIAALGAALRHDTASALKGFRLLCAKLRTQPDARRLPLRTAIGHELEILADGLHYLTHTDLRSAVSGIACPTLVLHAREDAVIPVGAGEALAAAIPRSQLVLCEGIGHDLPLRAPQVVAEAVRASFQRNA